MDDRRGSACRQDWTFLRFFLITWRSDTFAYWTAAALASPVERPAGRPAWANAIGAAPRCTALRRVAGTHLIGYAVPAAETAGYKTADKEWMWERERERGEWWQWLGTQASSSSTSSRRWRSRWPSSSKRRSCKSLRIVFVSYGSNKC